MQSFCKTLTFNVPFNSLPKEKGKYSEYWVLYLFLRSTMFLLFFLNTVILDSFHFCNVLIRVLSCGSSPHPWVIECLHLAFPLKLVNKVQPRLERSWSTTSWACGKALKDDFCRWQPRYPSWELPDSHTWGPSSLQRGDGPVNSQMLFSGHLTKAQYLWHRCIKTALKSEQ